jgi:hypothetical protein
VSDNLIFESQPDLGKRLQMAPERKDRMISPKTQQFLAQRMKATVWSLAVDHTPLLTAPDNGVEIIVEAAKAALR